MRTTKRSREQRGPAVPKTWAEAFDRCPFRTIIGVCPPHRAITDLLPQLSHAIAMLGGDPTPISPAMMAEIVASVQAGGAVLILSDRADLRDYAKREILAMALPAAGRA